MPISKIDQVNLQEPGILPGFIHFQVGQDIMGARHEASNRKNGLIFLKEQQPAFEALKAEVERIMDANA